MVDFADPSALFTILTKIKIRLLSVIRLGNGINPQGARHWFG